MYLFNVHMTKAFFFLFLHIAWIYLFTVYSSDVWCPVLIGIGVSAVIIKVDAESLIYRWNYAWIH